MQKDGEDPGTTTIKSSTKRMAFGNILAGRIFDAAVDMGTGAAYDYSVMITVALGMTTIIAPAKAADVQPTGGTASNRICTKHEGKMKRAMLLLAISLSGCATYNLDLLPRGPGAMAHGMAKQIDKSVTVNIGNTTFQGRYAYMEGGSFSLATGFAGGQTATATGMGFNAVGNGNVLAQSADGHNLRCVFSFSGWSQQGTGVCLTDAGSLYDLQITR